MFHRKSLEQRDGYWVHCQDSMSFSGTDKFGCTPGPFPELPEKVRKKTRNVTKTVPAMMLQRVGSVSECAIAGHYVFLRPMLHLLRQGHYVESNRSD